MAKKIQYSFNNQDKVIQFAQDKFNSMFEAIASAEGFDIKDYVYMEHQVSLYAKDKAAVRSFRDEYFRKLGITNIKFIKE
jgi:hypothetical protein